MGNWKDGSVDKILHKHKALVQIPRHIQKLDTAVSVCNPNPETGESQELIGQPA